MGKLFVAVIVSFFFLNTPARAQIQVIQASDLHSQNNHLIDFIKAVSHLREEFKAKHPNGKSVLLFNGDVAGPSEWTDIDKGMSFFRMAARLSNRFDGFAFTLGNHDGWSFGGPSDKVANYTFYQQAMEALELFKKFSKHSGRYTTANVIEGVTYGKILQPSIDVELAAGRKLRVVGLIGKDVLSQSNYNPNVTPNPFREVTDPFEESKRQIVKAAQDGITDMYLMAHEGHKVLEKSIPEMMEWKSQHKDRRVREMNLPLFFAAHTHLEAHQKVGGLSLIESGSRYQFSEIILNENGQLERHENYRWPDLERIARIARVSEEARQAIAAVEPEIEEMARRNSVARLHTEGIDAIRADLRKGPHWLGSAMADSFREAARKYAIEQRMQFDDVFGLFTSDAYRRDERIPPGPLTDGLLKSIHPLPNEVVMGLMSGRALKALLQRMRLDFGVRGDFSPQVSSNLIEEGEILMSRQVRKFFLEIHMAKPISDSGRYFVAIDGFNGARIRKKSTTESWGQEITWVEKTNVVQTEIIVEYLPKTLAHPDIVRMLQRRCTGAHLVR